MAIKFGRVTDEWRVVIADSDDPGREPDIIAADVTATFTPHIDMVQQVRAGRERPWTMALVPLTAIYVDGVLVGEDGEDGMELVSEIDGQPVFWEITRVASYLDQTWTPAPVTVRPTPGEAIHLPTLTPMKKVDLPQTTTVFVDIAAITKARQAAEAAKGAAESAKGGAESAKRAAESAKSAAAESATAAGREKSAAESAKTAAEAAKRAAESAKTAAERAKDGVVNGIANALRPGDAEATVNGYAAGKARTIVSRTKDGQIAVSTPPTDGWSATSKAYVDNHTWPLPSLEQYGATGRLSVRGKVLGINFEAEPHAIPVRTSTGGVTVAEPRRNDEATPKSYVDQKVGRDVGVARSYVDGKLEQRPAFTDLASGVRLWHKHGVCMLRISHGTRAELEKQLPSLTVPEGLRPAWSAFGKVLNGGTLTVGGNGEIKLEGNDLHNGKSIYAMCMWLAWQ